MWSHGVDPHQKYDQFESVPGLGDVKVHTERLGPVVHVFVDAASRVEVSARDIRSRIAAQTRTMSRPVSNDDRKLKEVTVRKAPTSETEDLLDNAKEISVSSSMTPRVKLSDDRLTHPNCLDFTKERKPLIDKKTSVTYCTVLCSQITLVLQDDQKIDQDVNEVLRLIVNNVVVSARPRLDTSEKLRALYYRARDQTELKLFIGDCQIDNQLYSQGKFDFPVILLFQKDNTKLPVFSPLLPIERTIQIAQNEAKFRLSVLIEKTPFHKVHFQSVNIRLLPLKLYAEDIFFYSLVEILQSFMLAKVSGTCSQSNKKEDSGLVCVKLNVLSRSLAIANPLNVEDLTIEAINAELSVHASVKLYIALEHSPLQFTPYKRSNIVNTSYTLGHNIAMHYISGALVRAGWVVGSLEILGNPGGFARTLGCGVKDFVQLPYEGILLGPWAFISGVTHGSLSLMKHFTAGQFNLKITINHELHFTKYLSLHFYRS